MTRVIQKSHDPNYAEYPISETIFARFTKMRNWIVIYKIFKIGHWQSHITSFLYLLCIIQEVRILGNLTDSNETEFKTLPNVPLANKIRFVYLTIKSKLRQSSSSALSQIVDPRNKKIKHSDKKLMCFCLTIFRCHHLPSYRPNLIDLIPLMTGNHLKPFYS